MSHTIQYNLERERESHREIEANEQNSERDVW